jgi:hypothetical protein
MGLTIKRLRQCVAAITERKWLESRAQWQNLTWQTRMICRFVAATVPVPAGTQSSLLVAAEQVGAEPNQPDKSTEPEAGSYERFMAAFGR